MPSLAVEKCDRCNNVAVWEYEPKGNPRYCDGCVPRGCSCQIDPDTGIDDTDNQGRLYPCCEYVYSAEGFEKND